MNELQIWPGQGWRPSIGGGPTPSSSHTYEEAPDFVGPPLDAYHEHAGDGQREEGAPVLQALTGPAWEQKPFKLSNSPPCTPTPCLTPASLWHCPLLGSAQPGQALGRLHRAGHQEEEAETGHQLTQQPVPWGSACWGNSPLCPPPCPFWSPFPHLKM